jgi:hypothetical protein
MSTSRELFVKRFGEDQAASIERACAYHKTESIHLGENEGNDPFRYALLMVIASGCLKTKANAEYHSITISPTDFKDWCLEQGDIAHYQGPIPDYLALFFGAYNSYIKPREETPLNVSASPEQSENVTSAQSPTTLPTPNGGGQTLHSSESMLPNETASGPEPGNAPQLPNESDGV